MKVGRHTMAELLYGVYSGSFQKLGKLSGHSLYAEQVGMVGPFKNQLGADAGLLGYFSAATGSGTFLKKLFSSCL